MIEFDRAEFVAATATGTSRVLHPITLRLTERRIALIGANGSGKSSLARLVNGLVEPTAGHVRVSADADAPDGQDPGSARNGSGGGAPRVLDTVHDGAAVRRTVGFVFTDPAAQLVMPTAIEDVALSLRRDHPRRQDRLAAAHRALADFGLEGLADRSVHTLSGGQRQLLALASVLASGPAILVADEPTTLLDLRNSRLITELLFSLPQQLVVATHDLELASLCDRVIVIDNGAVAHDSTDRVGTCPTAEDAQDGVRGAIEWYRESIGA